MRQRGSEEPKVEGTITICNIDGEGVDLKGGE